MPYMWFDENFHESGRFEDWPSSDSVWETNTRQPDVGWETLVLRPEVCLVRRREPDAHNQVYLLMWREL